MCGYRSRPCNNSSRTYARHLPIGNHSDPDVVTAIQIVLKKPMGPQFFVRWPCALQIHPPDSRYATRRVCFSGPIDNQLTLFLECLQHPPNIYFRLASKPLPIWSKTQGSRILANLSINERLPTLCVRSIDLLLFRFGLTLSPGNRDEKSVVLLQAFALPI